MTHASSLEDTLDAARASPRAVEACIAEHLSAGLYFSREHARIARWLERWAEQTPMSEVALYGMGHAHNDESLQGVWDCAERSHASAWGRAVRDRPNFVLSALRAALNTASPDPIAVLRCLFLALERHEDHRRFLRGAPRRALYLVCPAAPGVMMPKRHRLVGQGEVFQVAMDMTRGHAQRAASVRAALDLLECDVPDLECFCAARDALRKEGHDHTARRLTRALEHIARARGLPASTAEATGGYWSVTLGLDVEHGVWAVESQEQFVYEGDGDSAEDYDFPLHRETYTALAEAAECFYQEAADAAVGYNGYAQATMDVSRSLSRCSGAGFFKPSVDLVDVRSALKRLKAVPVGGALAVARDGRVHTPIPEHATPKTHLFVVRREDHPLGFGSCEAYALWYALVRSPWSRYAVGPQVTISQ